MDYDELMAKALGLIGDSGKIPETLFHAESIFKEISDYVQQVPMFISAADKRLQFQKEMESDHPVLSDRLEYAWYVFLERVCSAPTSIHRTSCVILRIPYIYSMMTELKKSQS